MEVKIAYRILAVRERQDFVNRLLKRIDEPETSVFWDEEHKGCMWNALRLWRSYKTLPKDVTHLCLLADDADPVNNFKKLSKLSVERFPDAIWTFYSNTLSLSDRPQDTPYIQLFNCNARGIVYLMPVCLVQGYIDFYDKWLSSYPRWTHDDTTCKMYALTAHIPVMLTIPNLVRSMPDAPSVIPDHRKTVTKNTDAWQGYDLDEKQFYTHDFEMDKKRTLFPLHLKDDAPVCKFVREEFERLKKIERIYGNGNYNKKNS